MENCLKEECSNKAIYLEDYCWQHLTEDHKRNYPVNLLIKINQNAIIEGENFESAEFIHVKFASNTTFRRCIFVNSVFHECVLKDADLKGSNFTNAILKDCHFEDADFRGTDTCLRNADVRESHFNRALLQNVDFSGADLRDAIFIEADMVGSMLENTDLYSSRFMNTRMRKECFSNFSSNRKYSKASNICIGDELSRECDKKIFTPLFARFVYTSLKNNFHSTGEYDDERWARNKERLMERKRLFKFWFYKERKCDSLAREQWDKRDKEKVFESRTSAFFRWVFRWFCTLFGYAEKPFLFMWWSLAIILICAGLFLFSGFAYENGTDKTVHTINRNLCFEPSEAPTTISDLGTSLYFSIVTFTTLGYGDARPVGNSRIISSTEALLGFLMYSSLVGSLMNRLSSS